LAQNTEILEIDFGVDSTSMSSHFKSRCYLHETEVKFAYICVDGLLEYRVNNELK